MINLGKERYFIKERSNEIFVFFQSQIDEGHLPLELKEISEEEKNQLTNPMPTEEELSKSIRDRRNLLLRESDWVENQDIPFSTKLEWRAYRKALREVTDQPGFPNNITWPVAPDE